MNNNQSHGEQESKQMLSMISTFICMLIMFVFTIITNMFFQAYSEIAYGLLNFTVCLLTWILFDKFYLKGIYTITEIKNGNIAFAIFAFGFIYLLTNSFKIF